MVVRQGLARKHVSEEKKGFVRESENVMSSDQGVV